MLFVCLFVCLLFVHLVWTVGVRQGEEEVVGVQTDSVQSELGPLVSHPVCQYSVPVKGLIHLNPSKMDIGLAWAQQQCEAPL